MGKVLFFLIFFLFACILFQLQNYRRACCSLFLKSSRQKDGSWNEFSLMHILNFLDK